MANNPNLTKITKILIWQAIFMTVTVSVVSNAFAASPVRVTVNGYIDAFIGYTDIKNADKNKYNKVDVATKGQIIFNADTVLDNGIKLGATAQLNVGNANNLSWLGNVFMYGQSKYGELVLGATDGAGVMLMHDINYPSTLSNGTLMGWVGIAKEAKQLYAFELLDKTAPSFDSNEQKITYITPDFSGFRAGFSYIAGAYFKDAFGDNNGALNDSVVRTSPLPNFNPMFFNAYMATGAYNGKIGQVSLGADIGFSSYNMRGSDATASYNGNLQVSFADFTATVGYLYMDWRDLISDWGKLDKSDVWQIGLGYHNDRFALSASIFKSTVKYAYNDYKPKLDIIRLEGAYTLTAGVKAFALFGYTKAKDFIDTDFAKTPKSWTIISGIALNF